MPWFNRLLLQKTVDRPSPSKQDKSVPYDVRPFQRTAIKPPLGFSDFQWPDDFFSRPVDVEIGCGVGWHPIRYAQQHTDRNLIAIEHTRAKFERFRSRLKKHPEIQNLLPVHADAVRWVSHFLAPSSVSKFMILFPNPEPKSPNKRWIRMPFMHRVLEVLAPQGEIQIATNERAYFEEILEYGENHWNLPVLEKRVYDSNTAPAGVPRTHFEKKYLLRGETCFDVRFQKP